MRIEVKDILISIIVGTTVLIGMSILNKTKGLGERISENIKILQERGK